ncbi:hypothetical protein B0H11DRAFT_1989939 [Mycena galericulata]|nr:hypothetical protein B0H11DRAFT_1989939 [Mycena galericulata]
MSYISYVYLSARGDPLLFTVLPLMFACQAFLPLECSTCRRLAASDLRVSPNLRVQRERAVTYSPALLARTSGLTVIVGTK